MSGTMRGLTMFIGDIKSAANSKQ